MLYRLKFPLVYYQIQMHMKNMKWKKQNITIDATDT